MIRSFGGVTITLPLQVWIVDPNRARPTFHRLEHKGCGSGGSYSACGHRLTDADDHPPRELALALPTRHALRFARPCRRCWPALQHGTLELLAGALG